MQTLSLYLLSMDRARDRLKVSIVGGVVMTLGCLAVVPFFAAEGAAIVRIGVFTVMCMIMVRYTRFGSQLSGLYVSLFKTLVAAAICAIIALIILHYLNGSIGLLLAIAAGGVGYIVALKFLKAIPREDAEVMLSIVEKMPGSVRNSAKRAVEFVAPTHADTEDAATEEAAAPVEVIDADAAEGAGRDAALPFAFDRTIGLFKPETPERRSDPQPCCSSIRGASRKCAAGGSSASRRSILPISACRACASIIRVPATRWIWQAILSASPSGKTRSAPLPSG
jgi:hypothetical protein